MLQEGFQLQTCFNNKSNPYSQMQDYYFDSYSHYSIHQQMLKDTVRTKAYMKAIINNPKMFENKIVMDIGSGTGVLSIFAAKAGAKKVFAIENAGISTMSEEIIKENGLDHIIQIVKGKVEEIELPVKKVDIIISEWMGYFLLYESMFDSVLFARDKWLAKGGKLFPNKASMFIAAMEDEEYVDGTANFWINAYGFSMKKLIPISMKTPAIQHIPSNRIISNSVCFKQLDLEKVTISDLDFSADFSLIVRKPNNLNGFLTWFTTDFSHGSTNVVLSTSPFKKPTHWKQTAFYLSEPIPMSYEQTITGQLDVHKSINNPRQIDTNFTFQIKGNTYTYKYTVS